MKCLRLKDTTPEFRLIFSQRLLYYAYGSLLLAFLLVAACSVSLIYISDTENINFFMYWIGGLLLWNIFQVMIIVNIAKRIRQFTPGKNIKVQDVELNA